MKNTWQVLGRNRWYLTVSIVVFALGVLLGSLFSEQLLSLVKEALEKISELAEKAKREDSGLYTAQMIFWNNLRACVMMLLLGTLFGVFTLFSLLFNGMMIGVVFSMASGQVSLSLFDMIVFGLLPHGVFELPAIFIAAAFGIKLGRALLWPFADQTRWESYKFVWKEVWQISWFLLLLLVVAAGVEGFVTPQLLETFGK